MRHLVLAILGIAIFSGCGEAIRSADEERAMVLRYKPKHNFEFRENRIALVIGNGDYQNITGLDNPTNDSRAMRKKLSKLGFGIVYLENGTRKEMKNSIRKFQTEFKKKKNVVALFYYAGHGLESGGINYLIPVNANIKEEDEIDDEAVSLNFMLEKFEVSGNRLNIAILDSCRDNPFRGLRNVKGGLGIHL